MLVDYRLCNVLLADGSRSDEYPDLYYRRTQLSHVNADGSVSLSNPHYVLYDFATYFNAFSCQKWKRYTVVDDVYLRVVAKGAFTIRLVGYEETQAKPRRHVLSVSSHAFEGEYGVADLHYPATDAALLSFELLTDGEVDIREAYYYTQVEEDSIRPVELAVATTTFQKEDYVIPNITLFKEQVLGCKEPVAQHFTLHVIDNGRSLDVDAHESDHIHIHPNANVGGAGGFTRGMIEAMEQTPKATHVLLMDDDVQISPESIKRTYSLLALQREEFLDSFISGAMLSFERQDEFHEDVGYVNSDGIYGPIKQKGDGSPYLVSDLEDVVALESVEPRQDNLYAGWWYCCIPMRTIEEKGLPLPVFIRGDDAEYGNRCTKKFITMNGVCIWHLTLAFKFRAALERYQVPRNSLIAQATTGVYQNVDFMRSVHIFSGIDFKTFYYAGVELAIDALRDYMKGPDFIKHINCSDLNQRISKKNENLLPLQEFDDPAVRLARFNPMSLYAPQGRNVLQRAFDYLSCNGQRGPRRLSRGGLGVIPFDGWNYPPNEIRGKDMILAVSVDGSQGVLRKKDRARFAVLDKEYQATLKEYWKRKDEVAARWAAAREELTSVEFWKWYLKDQMRQAEE